MHFNIWGGGSHAFAISKGGIQARDIYEQDPEANILNKSDYNRELNGVSQ